MKLNKSLLLLSRIETGQFHETKEVEFNPIIKELVEDFQEIYEHKNLHVEVEENAVCKVHMNESLANILITNLLGWEVDDTLDTRMVLNALNKAFKIAKPQILNSDQGCQFTSQQYIDFVKENGIRQSMDGKSRWTDNL